MKSKTALWINGITGTGKTQRLVEEFRQLVQEKLAETKKLKLNPQNSPQITTRILVLAANDDNRHDLTEKLINITQGNYPIMCKTPLGFITDEVILFWPLIFEQLNLKKPQFPLKLRPETEQELATQLWRQDFSEAEKQSLGGEYRFVRRTLDLLQLAGASGIPSENIASILEQGVWDSTPEDIPQLWQRMGQLILKWRKWCLEQGLLSYGIIYELYWRYLLTHPTYQQHLTQRYQAVLADDIDDYPAICKELFDWFLDQETFAVFTYNLCGQIRLGLNADPEYLALLANRCQIESLETLSTRAIDPDLTQSLVKSVNESMVIQPLPNSIQSIYTNSRADLFQEITKIISQAVKQQIIKPSEIAIIAPGLDEIARYTLINLLEAEGIPIQPLNEQRPLIANPIIRALLTWLTLVYPNLGRLVDSQAVGEMLVIFSQNKRGNDHHTLSSDIDSIRANLLADYCFQIDPIHPCLLSIERFPRWDRLGYGAVNAYEQILETLKQEKIQQQQDNLTPAIIFDRAIKRFFCDVSYFSPQKLAALQELIETVQHYWELDQRLRQNKLVTHSQTDTISQFIQLLQQGTITANPRPIRWLNKKQDNIILATIFQYRSLRHFHPWQFWLDAGSNLWDKGGAATLFAAPLFLRNSSTQNLTPEAELQADKERLERILQDLCGRVGKKVYLCYSELGINGSEQTGPLLSLVNASNLV